VSRNLPQRSGGPAAPGPPEATPTWLAEARGLSAGYGGPPALTDVDFRIEPGQRVGVIGPNGGGKSTLFRAMLGELKPTAGSVDVRVRAGSVLQIHRSRLDYPVSSLDVALMGTLSRLPWYRRPNRAERRRALEMLGAVGMRDLAGSTFGELSGGQQQRVLVARALVQDARLLLMDEPFNGVDPTSAEQLMELIDRLAAEGRGLMIATHDVDQTRGWDRVLCLNHRQIAFGTPVETLTPETLSATYPSPIPGAVVVLPHHGHHPDDDEAATGRRR
jgi:ABC-type Mn2+/Zn2+ transport system ATPase subunit